MKTIAVFCAVRMADLCRIVLLPVRRFGTGFLWIVSLSANFDSFIIPHCRVDLKTYECARPSSFLLWHGGNLIMEVIRSLVSMYICRIAYRIEYTFTFVLPYYRTFRTYLISCLIGPTRPIYSFFSYQLT